MGAIQQSIDQTLRIGSALFTQTPVYKRQVELNLASRKADVALEQDKELENIESAEKMVSAARELYDIKPTAKNFEALDFTKAIRDARVLSWQSSQEQSTQERETKIRQQEFYKKFMGVLNE